MIPAEAVDVAKRVAYERYGSRPDTAYLRTILEAAAPHMLAGAWDEGWDTFAGFDSRPGGPYPANPYRPTP